jgi:hypothetical protein
MFTSIRSRVVCINQARLSQTFSKSKSQLKSEIFLKSEIEIEICLSLAGTKNIENNLNYISEIFLRCIETKLWLSLTFSNSKSQLKSEIFLNSEIEIEIFLSLAITKNIKKNLNLRFEIFLRYIETRFGCLRLCLSEAKLLLSWVFLLSVWLFL